MFAQSARRSEGNGSSSAQSGSKQHKTSSGKAAREGGGDDRDVIYAATKTDLAWEVEGAKTRGEA